MNLRVFKGTGRMHPALLIAFCAVGFTHLALATPAKVSASGIYWGGLEYKSGDVAINRLSLRSQLKKRWGRKWQLDATATLDWSNDAAGLGSTESYAPLTKPFVDTDDLRGQLERLTLRYRHKKLSVTLGKQVLAWGVLDGLRVADRVDPVRRRDFILAESRPERLGRWGLRTRTSLGNTAIDIAAFFDNTADQAPAMGTAFFPTAARSLGGFDGQALASLSRLQVEDRGHGLTQATWAMKLGRRLGTYDVQFIAVHGPDTEPLIQPLSAAEIQLRFNTRSLAALALQRALGASVVRFELAYIPDQSINLARNGQYDKVGRLLAGVGVDFRTAGGWFVNAQLGLDQLESHSMRYGRPRTDVIATLRAQKSFVQDRLQVKAELIGSPRDGDGYLGASVSWQVSDSLKAAVGTDILAGDSQSLFGQFEDRSRAWLRLTFTP